MKFNFPLINAEKYSKTNSSLGEKYLRFSENIEHEWLLKIVYISVPQITQLAANKTIHSRALKVYTNTRDIASRDNLWSHKERWMKRTSQETYEWMTACRSNQQLPVCVVKGDDVMEMIRAGMICSTSATTISLDKPWHKFEMPWYRRRRWVICNEAQPVTFLRFYISALLIKSYQQATN